MWARRVATFKDLGGFVPVRKLQDAGRPAAQRKGKKVLLTLIGGGCVGSTIYYQTLEEQQKRSCRVAASAIGRFSR
jgi:hypothetical protein